MTVNVNRVSQIRPNLLLRTYRVSTFGSVQVPVHTLLVMT
jgi:hypothetical protein